MVFLWCSHGSGSLVGKSCLTLVTSWTVACQATLSMGVPRQESWSGLPFPSPGDLPNPGIKLRFSALQADSLWTDPPGKPGFYGISISRISSLYVYTHTQRHTQRHTHTHNRITRN